MGLRRKIVLAVLTIGIALFLVALLILTKCLRINSLFLGRQAVIGVDISHYQGEVDMECLAGQGVSFVYIKATEGSGTVDERFHDNWERAGESGLPVGAYHFFSFDSDGEAQARHFIDTVGALVGRLCPVVDVEYYGDKEKNPPDKETVLAELTELLDIWEEEYHIKPMIYTTQAVYGRYLRDALEEYPLWIRSVFVPAGLVAGDVWTVWQYSDREMLEGVSGDEKYIDMDVWNGKKGAPEDFLCP